MDKKRKGCVTFKRDEEKFNCRTGRKDKQMPIHYRQNYKNHTVSIDRASKIATMHLANGGKRLYKEVNRLNKGGWTEDPKEPLINCCAYYFFQLFR